MPLFRVYYSDGTTYTGDPFLAPSISAQVIVQVNPDSGRELVACKDAFVWMDGYWRGVDGIGFMMYLLHPGPRKVLFGEWMRDEDFNKLVRQANEDPDFPIRTNWGNDETYIKGLINE